jgi:hypothetical protein
MSDGDKEPELREPAAPPSDEPRSGEPRSAAPPSDEPLPEIDEEMAGVLDELDMRDLLRSALAPPPGAVAPSILPGVQRKLRRRSRGKFYGDGWSTAKAPRSTYLVTSIVMLLLIAFVFLVLIPWGGGALP